MIQDIGNKFTLDNGKRNWIDQNNVVFGYDDYQQCCESWGWGVYDPETGEKVAEDPSGLPYHFDFEAGARADEARIFSDVRPEDTVQVTLVHDEDPTKRLIFECFNCHNGYYYHDFSFEKLKKERRTTEMNCEHGEDAPPMPTKPVTDAIKKMYDNRIAELEKVVMSALETNTKARNFVREGKMGMVDPMLQIAHDYLVIAVNTVHACKDFSQCFGPEDSQAKR